MEAFSADESSQDENSVGRLPEADESEIYAEIFVQSDDEDLEAPQGRGANRDYIAGEEFANEDAFLFWVAEQKTWNLYVLSLTYYFV